MPPGVGRGGGLGYMTCGGLAILIGLGGIGNRGGGLIRLRGASKLKA